MGVPVINLCGWRFASRVGDSIPNTAGLTDCVTVTVEAYIDRAIALA